MKILMVCLGNICRSPLAEGILRKKALERNVDLTVDSCGTSSYHIDSPPDPRSAGNAKINGLDISSLRARQFRKDDFENFDRIYVMDHSNFNDITYLAENDEQLKKVKLILNELEPDSNKAVPDPYFGGEDGFQTVYDLLDKACDKILDDLER